MDALPHIPESNLSPHLRTERLRVEPNSNKQSRRTIVGMARSITAGRVLSDLYGMECIADDGNGNRNWAVPAEGFPWRYRPVDEDEWTDRTDELVISTHHLKDRTEVAILHGDIPDGLPFCLEPGLPMSSFILMKAYMLDTGDCTSRWEVMEKILNGMFWTGPAYGVDVYKIFDMMRQARAYEYIEAGKGTMANILDLADAAPSVQDWAARVPASSLLRCLRSLTATSVDRSGEGNWDLSGRRGEVFTFNVKDAGVQVAWKDSSLQLPGMKRNNVPVSSYGILLALTGSKLRTLELIEEFPEPCEGLEWLVRELFELAA